MSVVIVVNLLLKFNPILEWSLFFNVLNAVLSTILHINQTTTPTPPTSQFELLSDIPVWRIVQILLTSVVALIPPLYPRLSLYKRRAEKGLETLEQPILVMGDIRKGTLEDKDDGFEELTEAIHNQYPLSGEIKRLNVLLGNAESLQSELDVKFGAMVGPNAVVYVDYVDEVDRDIDILTFHPFDPAQTLKLTELRRWVRNTTTERSHYATMIAALAWTVVSILSL